MDANVKKTALRMIPYGLYVLTAKGKDDAVAAATVNWVTCWPTTASRRPETSGGRRCAAIPRPRTPRAGGRGRGSYAGCSRSTSSCARAVPARAESWAR
jgi:hypothetical protein